jgi:putative mRNA 3-end processing factor
MLFDPSESDPEVADLFISHAHYDHARGFEFPIQRKHSTKETLEIYEKDKGRKVGNWQEVRRGRRLKVGDVEIEAHDAGHVLGSVQYEVITPEGNVVYASHINFSDTLLLHAAEVAPCDLLAIEATYPATSTSQPRESVIADIVKWSLECIKEHRIPAFETDSIGNAQELVRIFNLWTKAPVIVHPRIARINQVYETVGMGLKYFDASTEEALKLIEETQCVVIVPRRFDTTRYGNFRTAYVSGWVGNLHDHGREVFQLRDQANLDELLHFVTEARPKSILTFHGASDLFAQMLSKRLGIPVRQLVTEPLRKKTQETKLDEKRLQAFQGILMNFIQTAGFTYEKRDLMAFGIREGFRSAEVEETLRRLTINGVLKYSSTTDGYTLS